MPALSNLCRFFTSTTGTGTITIGAAVPGFLTPAQAGHSNGDTVFYAISDGVNSETGTGTFGGSLTTLSRSPVTSTGSGFNSAISLSGTGVQVFITPIASAITLSGSLTAGKVPKASAASTLVDSIISESSGKIGVGITPLGRLHSDGADGSFVGLFSGPTKAVRFVPQSTEFCIEATDQTGSGSYQTLWLGGSLLQFTISNAEVGRWSSTTLTCGGTSTKRISFSDSDQSFGMWIRNDGVNTVISTNIGDMYYGFNGNTKNHNFYSNATFLAQINSAGNMGVGVAPPISRLQVYGAGQTTVNFDTTGTLTDTLTLSSTGLSAGAGGAIMFAAAGSSWRFAAIKGYVTDGGNNTRGIITFGTRWVNTDSTLTESMRINENGEILGFNSYIAIGNGPSGTHGMYRMVPNISGTLYGAFWYNDGTTMYLLLTNNNDAFGAYNSLRPFYVDLASGGVQIGHGMFSGGAPGGNKGANTINIGSYYSNGGIVLQRASNYTQIFDNDGNTAIYLGYASDQSMYLRENQILIQNLAGSVGFASFDGTKANFAVPLWSANDGGVSCGANGHRWSEVWAVNGAIQTSDGREKTDVKDSDLGLDFVMALKPKSWRWRVGDRKVHEGKPIIDKNGMAHPTTVVEDIPGKRRHYGLIAQDVQEALSGRDFAGWILTDRNDPESQQSLRMDQFMAPVIAAIQELRRDNIQMRAELARLAA